MVLSFTLKCQAQVILNLSQAAFLSSGNKSRDLQCKLMDWILEDEYKWVKNHISLSNLIQYQSYIDKIVSWYNSIFRTQSWDKCIKLSNKLWSTFNSIGYKNDGACDSIDFNDDATCNKFRILF